MVIFSHAIARQLCFRVLWKITTPAYLSVSTVVAPYIISLGDFNMPKISWSRRIPCCIRNIPCVLCFATLYLDINFTRIVSQPTRMSPTLANIPDLILKAPGLVHSISHTHSTSDHGLNHLVIPTGNTRQPSVAKTL